MKPSHQLRWHPLLDEWVIIAAGSDTRPWSGAVSKVSQTRKPVHDPGCHLCPRVSRATGATNPDYRGPFAFDNDFPALDSTASDIAAAPIRPPEHPLLASAPPLGRCRVVCWSERHDATLASLANDEMRAVIQLWRGEFKALATLPEVKQVLMFENKGEEIGTSNPHPHGQIYATPFVTQIAKRMCRAQSLYAQESGGSLLQSLLAEPYIQEHLLIDRNEHASVIVPYAARMPYETWVLPHRHVCTVAELSDNELLDMAALHQRQMQRYDRLFRRSAPNITLWHNAPVDNHPDNEHWCFHITMLPPLRDPNKLKFLAGFETGSGNMVNPVQPESAAAALRDT